MPGKARIGTVVPHHDVLRGVGTDEFFVFFQQFGGQPVRQGIIGKGFAVFRWRAIGGVYIPVVDVQKPVVVCGIVI